MQPVLSLIYLWEKKMPHHCAWLSIKVCKAKSFPVAVFVFVEKTLSYPRNGPKYFSRTALDYFEIWIAARVWRFWVWSKQLYGALSGVSIALLQAQTTARLGPYSENIMLHWLCWTQPLVDNPCYPTLPLLLVTARLDKAASILKKKASLWNVVQ